MKKTHRAVLSILLVLTLLTALPLTALAEETENNVAIDETKEFNLSEIDNNYGKVVENGVYATQGVTVIKVGIIKNNEGTVDTNSKQMDGDTKAVIQKNSGNVGTNSGLVGMKDENGYLITNDTSGNYGIVTDNKAGGEVCNREGGEVTNNYRYGYVENYGGTVKNNNAGGNVVNYSGIVEINNANGTVDNRGAEVTYNSGTVTNSGGTVTNNKEGGIVNNGGGTVQNNSGTVDNIGNGKVVTNNIDGVVNNDANGTVETNYGTVHQKNADGTDTTTFYGLQKVDNDTGEASLENVQAEDGRAEVDLSKYTRSGYELAEYKLYQGGKGTEYTSNTNAPTVIDKSNENTYKITISMPSKLELFWKKLAAVFTPVAATASSGNGGGEAVPTSYKPKYIGLGSVIFINEKGYKVVEIKDDAYVVVSFDALSDEDVQDLDALFAKLFTPEQQKLIKNVGQLLDSEDVLTVFGTPGNHPVYEISKDLVK